MLTNLTSILRHAGLLSLEQEQQVRSHMQASNTSVLDAVTTLGYHSNDHITLKLSELFGLDIIVPIEYDYSSLCQQLGIRELVSRLQALPLYQTNHTLHVAVSDPSQIRVEEEFGFATNLSIELVLCEEKQLQACIKRLYGSSIDNDDDASRDINEQDLANLVKVTDNEHQQSEDLSKDDSPVSRFIHQVLLDAIRKSASDIHFEPYEDNYRIRMRCDGMLLQTNSPPSQLNRRLAARLKILANLDIAERRLPQDGRIKLHLNSNTAIDLRVSTLPTLWGEKVVLRLLDSNKAKLDINALGYSEQQKQIYLEALSKPQGMILMTGPTGSGKTISLYTGLRKLNKIERNISTAEDPVEINFPGINQVQIQPKVGFTFAKALRAFLRQDPDVVMLGEIRDLETAQIAIKAAQTGHLVLSTLHTNSASETVIRLQNMGIEAYNLASSLSLVVAQRLARRLCPKCKTEHPMPQMIRQALSVDQDSRIYQANKEGCNDCNAGYSGRIGIYEMLQINDDLVEAITKQLSIPELEAIAVHHGMVTLKQAGIEKLKLGITSYQELQRVLFL
ncbi:type IV-A pilus assembly ATPase PilB [Vibrio tapetis subsp. quintayensis]|uniref:type IV-A pilus assembly ATPase PilB n=1 Tax=Vibrio tapetis TaxID=52443 RepID=UPI0025B4B8BE|nr:type IV-A pilus assembly ATPase PilB [Vibrio tapetis]MDN3681534.1 type IV-A pilus assembly ATPase PilB [Vibrio tapetis subsp. quintayensis]